MQPLEAHIHVYTYFVYGESGLLAARVPGRHLIVHVHSRLRVMRVIRVLGEHVSGICDSEFLENNFMTTTRWSAATQLIPLHVMLFLYSSLIIGIT